MQIRPLVMKKIKEMHILTVGGFLEFPILSHMLLRRENGIATFSQLFLIKSFSYFNGNDDIQKSFDEFEIRPDQIRSGTTELAKSSI